LDPRESRLAVLAEAQLAWDDLFRKISLTDEERHDKHPGREHPAQHAAHGRLLLPKARHHLRKQPAPPQLIRVLVRRPSGVRIQCRAVPDKHQRCVLK
jgi:hypothetical protein